MILEIDTKANVDWIRICLDLRKHYRFMTRVAKMVGTDEQHLNRLVRGDVMQPKYSVGINLLALHRALKMSPDLNAGFYSPKEVRAMRGPS